MILMNMIVTWWSLFFNYSITKSFKNYYLIYKPASWSSGNAFVSEAGGLRFKSQTGQIGQSVANGSLAL